jgi:acyl-coenzyme A thioesterase 7
MSPPVVARVLFPDDANVSGNVHGGTILQLMESAGMISATRHCNNKCDPEYEHRGKQLAGLVRFETMTFLQPVFVGEVASVTADIIFTSESSVLVKVAVTAENFLTGKIRVTNTGLLWYLSFVGRGKEILLVAVPQVLALPDDKQYQKAKAMYEARKSPEQVTLKCLDKDGCLCPECRAKFQVDESCLTPSDSAKTLCQCVLPGDCGTSNVAYGGFIMKLMDNAAGYCALSHTRTNIVTVSISSMDFTGFVKLGDIVTIRSKMVFCSAKSMEILVTASASRLVSNVGEGEQQVAQGTFTFVSLSESHKVLPVPPLRLETPEEFELAFASQILYEKVKQARIAKK